MKTNRYAIIVFCATLILVSSACSTTQPGSVTPHQPVSPTLAITDQLLPTDTPIVQLQTETAALALTNEPEMEFNLSGANHVPPEDVLEEAHYYMSGGGGLCSGEETSPDSSLWSDMGEKDLMAQSSLIVCGLEKDEILTGTIKFPDGRIKTESVEAQFNDPGYYGKLSFTPTLDDPVGAYTFVLTGKRGTVSETSNYHKSDRPSLLLSDDTHIFFAGFAPQESVRLLCYAQYSFIAWQEIIMDQSGSRYVRADHDKCMFVSIGEISGEVSLKKYKISLPSIWIPCSGLRARLSPNRDAKVITPNLPIRTAPGFSQPETGQFLSNGMEVRPWGKVKCVEGHIWWLISVKGAREPQGWIPEEQDGVYLLEPLPRHTPPCGGLPSRLEVGMEARAALTDGTDMHIRANSGFSKEILMMVPEGTVVTILGGPRCDDGSFWWRVYTGNGLDGRIPGRYLFVGTVTIKLCL